MTTFNTTACKVKVNGQWTPLLAIGGSGGGGGLLVHFTGGYGSNPIVCDHTNAEIAAAAEEGVVVGEYEGNLYTLTSYGSSYAYFQANINVGYGGGDLYILEGSNNNWTKISRWIADISDVQDEDGNSLLDAESGIVTIPAGGGGGGLMVHFSGSGSSVTCDHTVAEIVTAAASGPVTGELNDNVFVLSQYGSGYATFIYSGDYDYGGEDYYILSSNYGSNTWTLTEKFKADIYDVQDANGNSLINNDHIAVIPSGGGGDVEWAEYGVTTSQTIYGWYTSGKCILCNYNGTVYICANAATATSVSFYGIKDLGSLGADPGPVAISFLKVSNSTWTTVGNNNLERLSYKVANSYGWSSSSEKYPSCLAVEQYVAAQFAAHGIS